MIRTCVSCGAPIITCDRVTLVCSAVINVVGDINVLHQDVLCSVCGYKVEAEIENVTEPDRLILEISPELRKNEEDRAKAVELLSWFVKCSSTFFEQTGAEVLRARLGPSFDESTYRLVVTTTRGQYNFMWSKDSSLLVSEEAAGDPQLVFALQSDENTVAQTGDAL